MKLIDALELAFQLKGRECSHETACDYRSYLNNFKYYLRTKNKIDLQLSSFKKREALFFLDYLVLEKKHEPVTRNNNLRGMKGLFYILKDREYVDVNPFVGIKPLQTKAKRRKVFSKIECKIILNYLKDNDVNLLLAVAFCYYTALRRTELLKLKIGDIDLKKGVVLVDGSQTKNKKLAAITIPKQFLEYLNEVNLKKYPDDWFVFGYNMVPGIRKCNTNTIPDKHRAMLRALHGVMILPDIQGKSFYSWKDTAARDMIEEGISAPALQRHFRHSSLETTQRYLESFGMVDDSIRVLNGNLF